MNTVSAPGYRNRIYYHAALLWAMAAICSAALVVAYKATFDDIQQRQREDMLTSLRQVMPTDLYDNDLLADKLDIPVDSKVMPGNNVIRVFRASKQHVPTGYAYQISGTGYAGPIEIIMAVDINGKILGVRVIAHAETPGLGDKIEIKKSNWIESFKGLLLGNPPIEKWQVKKDGGQFDQFTGATITPRGVVKAVKQGLEFFQQHKTELIQTKDTTSAQKSD